jgi:hypothetical protein
VPLFLGETDSPHDIAERLHELIVVRPCENSYPARHGFLVGESAGFLEPVALWRGAIVLYLLFVKSKENQSIKPVFEAYYNRIIGEAAQESDVERLGTAIKHVALLPQLDWGARFLQGIAIDESPLAHLLKVYRELSTTFSQIKQFLDKVFVTMAYATRENFDEQAYLATNLDVAGCVAQGVFSSGLEHFRLHGYREGRKWTLYPPFA